MNSPNSWIVQTNSGSYFTSLPAPVDLSGISVHEFGHILGLADSANNVMSGPTLGQNLARYPVGDDIKGARTLYYNSGQPQIYWRKLSSAGWSAQSTAPLPGWTHMHVTSAIGASGSSNVSKVVVGIWGTDQKMYWSRADLPLSSSTSWSTVTVGSSYLSWRPPAVAARKTGTPLWVSAWSNQWDKTSDACPGVKIFVSTDAFSSGTIYSQSGICTVQTMALTHDPQSNKFVLAYVKRAGVNAENDKIYMTTSSDGVTWSAEVDVANYTGSKLYGFDAPGLACAPSGNCMLSYPYDGSNDPVLITRKFTVGSGGLSIESTWTYHPDKVQRTLPAAATSSGGSDRFIFAELWSTDPADWAESIGAVWTSTSSVVPYSSFDWQGTGITTKHAPAIAAGSSLYDDTYIFYTQ